MISAVFETAAGPVTVSTVHLIVFARAHARSKQVRALREALQQDRLRRGPHRADGRREPLPPPRRCRPCDARGRRVSTHVPLPRAHLADLRLEARVAGAARGCRHPPRPRELRCPARRRALSRSSALLDCTVFDVASDHRAVVCDFALEGRFHTLDRPLAPRTACPYAVPHAAPAHLPGPAARARGEPRRRRRRGRVYAGHADGVDVCLFDAGDTARRDRAPGPARRARPRLVVRLRRRASRPGSATTCASTATWDPDGGLRHNPAKLLLDPYARAVEGEVTWGPEVYGHVVDATWRGDGDAALRPRQPRPRAALRRRRRRVRLGGRPPAGPLPQRDRDLRGARAQPDRAAPRRARGAARHVCRAGPPRVRRPPRLGLGVTAVELLPVHAFTHEPHLVAPGPDEPLGLQHPRVLRAPRRLRRGHRPAGRASTRSRAWSSCCTARASR